MANWLALTWANDRLLLLSANIHNGSATFEHCAAFFAAPPVTSEKTTDEAAETDEAGVDEANAVPSHLVRSHRQDQFPSIARQLAEYLKKNRLTKTDVAVVLSRTDVEVRAMLFPPVPVEELPDLVRFQAAKEFNAYDATAPLDFFSTTKLDNVSRSSLFPVLNAAALKAETAGKFQMPSGTPKHLIASTIRLSRFQHIQKQCDEWGLPLKNLLLRPCQSAYLWRQSSQFDPGRSVLFVELDATETSQVVLFQGEPIFMRTPKMSSPDDVSAADFAARLIAELKRTRIAARNEIQGVTLDEVVLCGAGKGFETLARQVSEAMNVPVLLFDPWQNLQVSGDLKAGRPEAVLEKPERFAPLLGALLQKAKSEKTEAYNIDFCNPKKKPQPVGKRNLLTGIVAAVLIAIVSLGGLGLYFQSTLKKEVQNLNNRLEALKRQIEPFRARKAQLDALENWQKDKVNWFEELDWLARNAPDARDMMVTNMPISAANGGGMTLDTLLRDSSVVTKIDETLSDAQHLLQAGELRENTSASSPYRYSYNFSIRLGSHAATGTGEPAGPVADPVPEPPNAEQASAEQANETNDATQDNEAKAADTTEGGEKP